MTATAFAPQDDRHGLAPQDDPPRPRLGRPHCRFERTDPAPFATLTEPIGHSGCFLGRQRPANYAAHFTKDVKYDSEKTGLGWKTDYVATSDDLTLPTTCKMKRPKS